MLATALTVYRKNCRLTQKRLAEISGWTGQLSVPSSAASANVTVAAAAGL